MTQVERLPYGATFISNSLQSLGLRNRDSRRIPVEAPWSHDTFHAATRDRREDLIDRLAAGVADVA